MPDEWQPLQNYLEENNIISIERKMSKKEIVQSDINKDGLFRYFINKKYQNKLNINYLKPNLYSIDSFFSPIIEFSRSFYDTEKNILKRGRLYYTKNYWNDTDEWEEKPADFIQTADILFKWFRKTYKNVKLPEHKEFLITQRVKYEMENKGLKLQEN